ncbi:MAG TPA: class I SAM-dependent methyltransferase [Methanosarcinaceae archaeon]|nr:class I SAM-dependent methyltransferase [Methanosarcinaceae archaeon]
MTIYPTHHPTPKSQLLAWEQEYTHITWGGPRSTRTVRDHLLEGSRVLDAGCGNGRHLLPLSRRYCTVGIDISKTALVASGTYLEKSGQHSEHLVSSVTELPFDNDSFGGIVCYGVLQHLFAGERRAAVSEFKRVLSPGGFLFFEAFGVDDMRYGGTEVEPDTFLRKNGVIYHYFTKEEVSSLLRGFEIIKLENARSEKKFRGEIHSRHMIKVVARLF